MGYAQRKLEGYTVADYMGWTDDTFRCELIDGVVYDMSAASVIEHQRQLASLHFEVERQVREARKYGGGGSGKCVVMESPVDVVLGFDTVVQPDLVVVCDPAKLANGKNVQGAPDFIAEFLSPSTAAKDKREKLALYERSGVPEYLVVDPLEQYAEYHAMQADGRYAPVQVMASEEILRLRCIPKLERPLHEIFGWPVPEEPCKLTKAGGNSATMPNLENSTK